MLLALFKLTGIFSIYSCINKRQQEEADRLDCKDNDDVTHLTSRKSNNTKGIKVSATPTIMSSQQKSTLAKEG